MRVLYFRALQAQANLSTKNTELLPHEQYKTSSAARLRRLQELSLWHNQIDLYSAKQQPKSSPPTLKSRPRYIMSSVICYLYPFCFQFDFFLLQMQPF